MLRIGPDKYGFIVGYLLTLIVGRVIIMLFMQRLQSSDGVNYRITQYEVPIMFCINISCFFTVLGIYIHVYSELTPFLKMWCFAELINSAIMIPYNLAICRVVLAGINQNRQDAQRPKNHGLGSEFQGPDGEELDDEVAKDAEDQKPDQWSDWGILDDRGL